MTPPTVTDEWCRNLMAALDLFYREPCEGNPNKIPVYRTQGVGPVWSVALVHEVLRKAIAELPRTDDRRNTDAMLIASLQCQANLASADVDEYERRLKIAHAEVARLKVQRTADVAVIEALEAAANSASAESEECEHMLKLAHAENEALRAVVKAADEVIDTARHFLPEWRFSEYYLARAKLEEKP